MRVLLLSFYYTPDFCAGSFRAQSISEALSNEEKVNHFYVYTTCPHRYGNIKSHSANKGYEKKNIIRFKVPQHNNKFLKQLITFFVFAIKTIFISIKNKNNIDLILITSSRFGTAFLGYLLSILLKKPLAIDIRDIFSDSLNSLNFNDSFIIKYFSKIIKKIETLIIAHAKWKNFVSPGFLHYHNDKNIVSNEINIFTNGIDNIFIKNRKFISGIKNSKYNKTVEILYAGNIGFGQGLEKIIIPLARIYRKKIVFKIIGDGSSKNILIKNIQKYDLKNILVYEPVNRSKLIEYYNSADFLFLHLNDIPAFERVIPSKIFEYATFDKPVLAGVSGAAKDFIEENLNGFYVFSPNDVDTAKVSIEKILKNKYSNKIDNSNFVKKYDRSTIMKKMINNMINTMENIK